METCCTLPPLSTYWWLFLRMQGASQRRWLATAESWDWRHVLTNPLALCSVTSSSRGCASSLFEWKPLRLWEMGKCAGSI